MKPFRYAYTMTGVIEIDTDGDEEMAREVASTALSIALSDVKTGPVYDIYITALTIAPTRIGEDGARAESEVQDQQSTEQT